MTNQHPITLPPAILQKLRSTAPTSGWHRDAWIAEQAAQWGADQELEACCELLRQFGFNETLPRLQRIRRPKPPSLKEQAQRILVENGVNLDGRMELDSDDIDTIARALESIND
jgi:hypothetical protein